MTEVTKAYKDGEAIVQEGEVGNQMFMILSGQVKILKEREGKETVLAYLKQGEIFGEMALVEEAAKRSASAVAHGDVKVLAMNKKKFLNQVRSDPNLALEVLKSLCARLRKVDEMLQDYSVKDQKRQDHVRNFMRAKGFL